MENQQRQQQQQRMGKTKLKLKTFFVGFHKQKELLDSDYESKTSIELYKNKRYIMAAGYNHHFQAYFLGGLVYIWPCKYYDC